MKRKKSIDFSIFKSWEIPKKKWLTRTYYTILGFLYINKKQKRCNDKEKFPYTI